MDFTTILFYFGFDDKQFNPNTTFIEKTDFGYEVYGEQLINNRKCPTCGRDGIINDYKFVTYKCSENIGKKVIFIVKKPRFYCKHCKKSFLVPLEGSNYKSTITKQLKNLILEEFNSKNTFSKIAKIYNVSVTTIIKIFDEKFKFVPRQKLPRVLCIDEIRFNGTSDSKYIVVLSNFENGELIDIIKSRKMPFMDEYFKEISEKERQNVKIFISDMYDGFASIRYKYFKNANHIVDLFHVIVQTTRIVNTLRTRTMNTAVEKESFEYSFMKKFWKVFLCRSEKIPDKKVSYNKTGEISNFHDLVYRCIKLSYKFSLAYDCLQELYKYNYNKTYKDALKFIKRISDRLVNSGDDDLAKVGRTYKKWEVEIAGCFIGERKEFNYSNATAESLNNLLKTLIKSHMDRQILNDSEKERY